MRLQTIERTLPAPSGPFVLEPLGAEYGTALSLIVPTYNEALNIAPLVKAVFEAVEPILETDWELIIVDDGSADGTAKTVEQLFSRYPVLRLLRRTGERGLASAVLRGYQAACGRSLGTLNADFQHPPALLPELIRELGQADLVVATRFAHGVRIPDWARHRRYLTAVAGHLGRLTVPRIFDRVSDPLSGYYLFRRDCIAGIPLHPTGFKTLIEILGRGTVGTIAERAYNFSERREGTSNLRLRDCLQYLQHLRLLRRQSRC